MAWRDTLSQISEELAEVRAQREQRYHADQAEIRRQRDELSRLAGELGIAGLLQDMNEILLEGKGELEHILSWERGSDTEDREEPGLMLEDDEDEYDVLSEVLTWEEGGTMEVGVDLGVGEDGIYLQVNGVEIRTEREALEDALVQGFRDELSL